jgi:hypothetical protein
MRLQHPGATAKFLISKVYGSIEDSDNDEDKNKETAVVVHRSFDSSVRRGKWWRKDVFEAKYPDKQIPKDSWVTRKGADGKLGIYTKVYNNEEGVEDFSEGSADEVQHSTVVDDGEDVLDDGQV